MIGYGIFNHSFKIISKIVYNLPLKFEIIPRPCIISPIDWTIMQISVYIIANQNIRIHKLSPPRIIIPTPEIVQPRLLIKDIPAIAERLHLAQRLRQFASTPQRRTPRIVAVADGGIAILIQNCKNIALQALDIRIRRAVVHHHRRAVLRIILNSASINRYFFPYIFQQISINPCILEQCTSR